MGSINLQSSSVTLNNDLSFTFIFVILEGLVVYNLSHSSGVIFKSSKIYNIVNKSAIASPIN